MSEKGYIHIYTGNGKGKTTAALGLCFRAAGYGIKSMFIQFMKRQDTGELNACKLTNSLITIEQYGSSKLLVNDNPGVFAEHKSEAEKGYDRVLDLIKNHSYPIIVLDEILNLLHFRLMEEEQIIRLIETKPETMELILTGRGATDELIRRADLVTEMREIKHYYTKEINARKGIEF